MLQEANGVMQEQVKCWTNEWLVLVNSLAAGTWYIHVDMGMGTYVYMFVLVHSDTSTQVCTDTDTF